MCQGMKITCLEYLFDKGDGVSCWSRMTFAKTCCYSRPRPTRPIGQLNGLAQIRLAFAASQRGSGSTHPRPRPRATPAASKGILAAFKTRTLTRKIPDETVVFIHDICIKKVNANDGQNNYRTCRPCEHDLSIEPTANLASDAKFDQPFCMLKMVGVRPIKMTIALPDQSVNSFLLRILALRRRTARPLCFATDIDIVPPTKQTIHFHK